MRLFNPQRGIVNHLLVLTFAFGFGMAVFAVLAVVSYRSAQQAKNTLQQAKDAAKDAGRKEQKAVDEALAKQLAESPYRSYVAPRNMGGFEIKFPKSWSTLLQEDTEDKQIELTAHPEFVRIEEDDETKYGLVVKLVGQRTANLLRDYNEMVADKELSAKSVKVSGLAATWFEGNYGDHSGAIVLVPYRDKTITFETQDRQYLPQLAEVIAQSKITP